MQLNKLPAAAGARESLELPPWLASIPQLPPELPSRTPGPSHPHFYGGFLVFLNSKVLKHPKLQPSERLDAFSPPFLGGSFLIRDSLQGWLPGPGAALVSVCLESSRFLPPCSQALSSPWETGPSLCSPPPGGEDRSLQSEGRGAIFLQLLGGHISQSMPLLYSLTLQDFDKDTVL